MSLPLIVRSEAEADIEAIYHFLEQAQAGMGRQFIVRVREVLERIETMPEMYGIVWQDVRAVRLKKFRYVVYYVAFADRTEVIAVMHGSRDHIAWQSRL